MRAKKLTSDRKIELIRTILQNAIADIITGKAAPELLGIVQNDLCHALAVIQSDQDDEMVIAKAWVTLEARLLIDRAASRGAIQLELRDDGGKVLHGK